MDPLLVQALAPVLRLVTAIELVAVIAAAFSGFAEARKKEMDVVGVFTVAFVTADAIGLGFFSIAGMALAVQADMPWIIAAMLGVVTGVFGGVLRDVILNEVPMVLRDGKPYALASFLGCGAYSLMLSAGLPLPIALWSAAGFIVVVRMVAWRQDWTLK